ncbi:hypothetical protein F5883DRAFT_649927 [Diaporthe sp. PMI_573]|nr:hypothetical protein F5883DRAFT_649927 [Diaporthaceae sp. PMI_573]
MSSSKKTSGPQMRSSTPDRHETKFVVAGTVAMKEGIGEATTWNGTGVVQVKVEIEVQTHAGPGGRAGSPSSVWQVAKD